MSNPNNLDQLIADQFGDYVFDNGRYKLKVEIINNSNNPSPQFKTEGSSGMDICANITEEFVLEHKYNQVFNPVVNDICKDRIMLGADSSMVIPTGIHIRVPAGFEVQVRPRSGLAAKHGVTVLNTPGTIDSDYTGEIKVILYNTGAGHIIKHGDRIAQLVIAPVMNKDLIKLTPVTQFNKETERGDGGFGSTGT